MKTALQNLLRDALQRLLQQGAYTFPLPETVAVERTRDKSHGDYASTVALALAKVARCSPRDLATAIMAQLADEPLLERCEIAGAGYINFFLSPSARYRVVAEVMQQGAAFGQSSVGAGVKVQVEFVSANPTGPLHVGHGRGAAYGATVANLLQACGYTVQREYYVNDAGRQMDILATSVWLRYLSLCGVELPFPANGYKGDYIWDIAAALHREQGEGLRVEAAVVMADLPADEPAGGDKELYIDALIARCKEQLGNERYRLLFDLGLNTILEDIRHDLTAFGVEFDRWYSERSLVESGAVERALAKLQQLGHLYSDKGAIWFRSTAFGDEKDRVVQRENGLHTYFASDIAYHMEKFERGFHRVIDIWGADHHGYVPRVRAALTALGQPADQFEVLLVQFAVLYQAGERMQMSTRSGEFVTLRELREEVGRDAARLFYVMRRSEQHMDFDLDLAKSQSNDNPVYYIQYAHARICSVLRQAAERGYASDVVAGLAHLDRLTTAHEGALLDRLQLYPELLLKAAEGREPHQLVHYLRELANELHSYYNAYQFMVEEEALRQSRLVLISAVRQVLANGLTLLGLSAPEQM